MTTDKKPKSILFDPTAFQWSGPDGRPIDCPFERVPGANNNFSIVTWGWRYSRGRDV